MSEKSKTRKQLRPDEFEALVHQTSAPDRAKDAEITRLTDDLQKEKDGRGEERFVWCFSLFILFDVIAFPTLGSVLLALLITIMELILLTCFASLWGVEKVQEILAKGIQILSGLFKKQGD